MKKYKNVFRSILTVILICCTFFSFNVCSNADSVQQKLQQKINELVDNYNNTTDQETKDKIQNILDSFGIDAESFSKTDIGKIIGGLSDNTAIQSLVKLGAQAFEAGIGMVKDVFSGGGGTSDGKDTATTTKPETTTARLRLPDVTSPTVPSKIIEENTEESTTQPKTVPPTAPTTQPPAKSVEVTTDDSGVNTSHVIVLVVLSVATVGVIVAMVLFFIVKRRQG